MTFISKSPHDHCASSKLNKSLLSIRDLRKADFICEVKRMLLLEKHVLLLKSSSLKYSYAG